MSRESSSRVGSGISVLRHVHDLTYVGGVNTVLVNPEDLSCLGIIQTTGLSITSRVQLTPQPNRLQGRRKLILQNLGPGTVFIGNSEVNTSNGLQLSSGVILELDLLAFGDTYAVSNATSDVRVIQIK